MSVWSMFDPVWSPEWVWLRYATFLRATLFLLIVAGAAVLLRRAPASVRAGLWAAALVALLPLPELRALPTYWSAHVVPAPFSTPMVSIGATMVVQSSSAASAFPWTSAVAGVWVLGAAVVLGGLLHGWATLAALAARARPLDTPAWRALLNDARADLSISRPVRLLRGGGVDVPLTWGTWRPTVLLPDDADGWPVEHQRAVLLHELVHVRRLDCLLALLSLLACALWWFHPGAWWAARRLRAERELACDERVLRAGVRRSDYAECLLRIADAAHGRRHPGVAVVAAAFFRRADLRARLRAVLDSASAPRPRGERTFAAAAAAAAVLAALLVGSMRLSPHPDVWWTALGSGHWATRAYAAENIARFGDPGSVAALHVALREEAHPSVLTLARFGERLRARSHPGRVRFGWPAPPPSTTAIPVTHP